jgi:hypothetical protein
VPTQALVLLNNRFVHDRSEQLATVIRKSVAAVPDQVKLAWLSVLKREPTAAELQRSIEHLATQSKIFSDSDRSAVLQQDRAGILLRTADSLVLNLNAENAVIADGEQFVVNSVTDLSRHRHHATQPKADARPTLIPDGMGDRPALYFGGAGQFMEIAGQVLADPLCTIVCVVRDDSGSGHRTLLSNWNGRAGNSTTSLFLGLTSETTVRFSDAFGAAGQVLERTKPFILTAVNGPESASVFQNGRLLKTANQLSGRRLGTAWVLGQQGNINGEFWKGDVAEIRVYDRALSDRELRTVETEVAEHYDILLPNEGPPKRMDSEYLALASLCHVLMNSNEFLFVD